MNYDTICLSSGGMFGISFIGVIDYLINEKIINLDNIKNYAGTSVGTIILFFIIIGYSMKEMNDIIIHFNFSKLDIDCNLDNIFNNYGINDGVKVICMLKFFLKNKMDIDDITFIELYEKYGKNFIVVGTNFSNGGETIFNYINSPNLSIITAIRISISIPFIFTPYLYNNEYYVDGGLTNMFPINHCNQETTIGIRLPYARTFELNNVVDIFINSIQIILKSVSCKDKYEFEDNIINIDHNEISIFNLKISLERKIHLLNMGRKFVIEHFNNNKTYIRKICSDILDEIISNIV